VKGIFDGENTELVATLSRLHDDAAATEERCTALAGKFEGMKTAILDKVRQVKGEATDMMKTYLAGEDDPLDELEFLTMAEGRRGRHCHIVRTLKERAGIAEVAELADWAIPIQERHLKRFSADP
jgi:hypothetical protein